MSRILALTLLGFGVVLSAVGSGTASMLGTFEIDGGYAKSSDEAAPTVGPMAGGLTFGAAYWRSALPMISLGAEVSYDDLGETDGTYVDPLAPIQFDVRYSEKVLRVTPAVRAHLGAPVGPSVFAQGGVGLYKYSWEGVVDGQGNDESQSRLGFNLGAGVAFPVAPGTRLNVQGNYHSFATDRGSTNYVTIRAGVGFGL